MPQISVIVPVYKVEKYIHHCVESILGQTFTDFELILVDDGSPDNCPAICDEYAKLDSRVVVIHQENRGLSCARNAGVDAARGKYICFVDSDDLVAPDYCRVLLELLKGSVYDFSFCGVHRFPDGSIPAPEEHADTAAISNAAYLQMQLERRTEFGVWNKLFRREFFEHIRFMPGKIHEDVIFSADLIRYACSGAISTNRQLYLYRQREDGIVAVHAARCSPDRIFAGEYLLNAVTEHCPKLTGHAMQYAVEYPWMFVDPIYVKGRFRENREFLKDMQEFLQVHVHEYEDRQIFSDIQIHRMRLFARSRMMYAFNAYGRLARVYLYRLIGKDAYRDGHGI